MVCCMPILLLPLLFACIGYIHGQIVIKTEGWSGSAYPQLGSRKCANAIDWQAPYLCDPDNILSDHQSRRLQTELERFSRETPCQCASVEQCRETGFILAVSLVRNIEFVLGNPSSQFLSERASGFCHEILRKWSLGECSNSAVILVWDKYRKTHICTEPLFDKYLSRPEAAQLSTRADQLYQQGQLDAALLYLHTQIENEVSERRDGREEERTAGRDMTAPLLTVALALLISGSIFALILLACYCGIKIYNRR